MSSRFTLHSCLSAPAFDLQSPGFTPGPCFVVRVQGALDLSRNNSQVAALLDDVFGPRAEPEIPATPPPAGSRAERWLDWIFTAQRQGNWRVFQRGTFEPADGHDLCGQFRIPTQPTHPAIPARFAAEVLNAWVLEDPENVDLKKLRQRMEWWRTTFTNTGPTGRNIRNLLVRLAQTTEPVHHLGQDIYAVGAAPKIRLARGSVSDRTSILTQGVLCDKQETLSILQSCEIPTTHGTIVRDEADVQAFVEAHGYPVVLKPNLGNAQRDVFVNLYDQRVLAEVLEDVDLLAEEFVMERHVFGESHRVALFDGDIISVQKMFRPQIVGDGKTTARALIEAYCTLEADSAQRVKTSVPPSNVFENARVMAYLQEQVADLSTVLPKGQVVYIHQKLEPTLGSNNLYFPASQLTPRARSVVDRIMTEFDIDECSIDFIGGGVTAEDGDFVVNEVNTGPAFPSNVRPMDEITALLVASVRD